MKNKKISILILLLSLISTSVYAQDLCSKSGYTVATINGILTDEEGARNNQRFLQIALKDEYKGEKINYQYFYNPTHVAGIGDAVDLIRQGLFDSKTDYDFVEMLNEASNKVSTQKLLLVGHSQGNFYANDLYDAIVNKDGGVPAESLGVYSVATPDDYVAGGGKYLTSDTDKIIAAFAGRFKTIMPPNSHIDLQDGDNLDGHNFSDIYLKYKSGEIVKGIKDSLDKLKTNTIQNTNSFCINPPKITALHEMEGLVLNTGDFLINGAVKVTSLAYNAVSSSARFIASSIGTLTNKGLALVGLVGSNSDSVSRNIVTNNSTNDTPNQVDTNNDIDENILNNVEVKDGAIIVDDLKRQNNTNSMIIHGGSGGSSSPQSEVDENLPEDKDPIPKVEEADVTAPVITLVGDSLEVVPLNGTYSEKGAKALDDKDGVVDVMVSGIMDTTKLGDYIFTYSAADKIGNISTLTRTVRVSTYKYIPKYSFGKNNGDGNNWQAWSFNGSTAYDWTDTYVDNYLHEQFKIKTQSLSGVYCGDCLERGIFNHDPQKGFETSDMKISSLEANPQNYTNNTVYDVSIQWDSSGYVYTISHNEILDFTGHTNVTNMNNNLWVGWDGSQNGFKNFPSGSWIGSNPIYPDGRTGGSGMILKPYPVYKASIVGENSKLSFVKKGPYSGAGINQIQGRENLTSFDFKIVYTDINNNPPQKVELNILNTKTGTILPVVSMNKVSTPSDEYSDGNFVNGEAYTAPGSLYDTGDYEYYFVAYDKDGKSIRFPEEDNLNFAVIPSTYKYLPKYSFGTNNGDGNNWQAWFFNGSIIYDWTDVYSHNYLREQFKIKTGGFGSYCSNCLERGLFSHDPQKGFEISDVNSSALEMNPQNNQNNTVYDVSIQWDASGYVYTISHGGVVDSTGHTNITNMSNDLWVGWDSSQNNFKNFPYGSWAGIPAISPDGRGGGVDMIMTPYPIYDPNAVQTPDPVVKSSEKEILSFDFYSLDPKVVGIIDNTDHTISLTVPYDTDITNLSPTIVVSDKAVITPASMSVGDFTNPVTYIVKAEDDSDTSYVVSVLVAPDPNPKPPVEETGDPNIKSYSLNDDTGNITINPLVKNLTIVLNANKKVNWMSVKIEKESDPKIYKMFLAGSSCVNGTNICTKVWTGILSSGGLLQSGNYKIKVHIKDADGREYEQYLPSVIMVNL